jgi:hypothetical protein
MRLVFDQVWTESNLRKAGELIFNYLIQMSVNQIFGIEIDEEEAGSITFLRNGLSQLAEQEKVQREAHQDPRQIIEQGEFASTVNAVLPQIFSVLISEADKSSPALRNLVATSMEDKRALLDQCSSFWCHYQIMTSLRSNRAFLKENDLWDLEHASTALPYVTCFACDGGTRHICSDVLGLDKKYETFVVSNVDELINWLDSE